MPETRSRTERDLFRKIKWLIFFRALFAGVLLGSVFIAILRPEADLQLFGAQLSNLIYLSAALLAVSIVYALLVNRIRHLLFFAYFQTGLDTFFITLIIFITGSLSSIFVFLYLVVIIYTTMVIYRRGGMVIATLCVLEYGIMVDLEYFRLIEPPGADISNLVNTYGWRYVLYKLLITIGACYGVAFLSGLLAEQERRAKQELWAIEDQMKRVERLAAVGEMAAGLTHEIKNPLASLTGSIQMLRESIPYDPSHDKLMQIVLREADRLSNLVTEFLMFARPQAGKIQNVRLDKAIREIVSLFKTAPGFNGRLTVEAKADEPLVVAIDPEHLRQVMWNLLNNAAEAIPGNGRIDVSLYLYKKTYACISVSDTGCGIPPENMDSVFDPFYSTKARGTGLGLSIVQQIISAYDGLVDVESTPGKGTIVTVRLNKIKGSHREQGRQKG